MKEYIRCNGVRKYDLKCTYESRFICQNCKQPFCGIHCSEVYLQKVGIYVRYCNQCRTGERRK